MKAAILERLNAPLVVDEVELPRQLAPGQVRVRVHYSGICGSQLGEIQGRKGPDAYLPHLLGHEGSGEALETGPGVVHVKPGDRVVLHWQKGPGMDAPCPMYRWRGKKLNAGFVTTFNSHAVVSENRLTPIPETLPMDVAPLMGCAVTTGLGVVNNNAKIKIGESVVILGAGGVGLNIIQGAAMASAYPIVALDRFNNRLEMARRFGATHVINTRETPDFSKKIRVATGAGGADVIIDNTGNTEMINFAYQATAPQGRVILVGVPKRGDNISIHSLALHFGKEITGSHGGETRPHVDIPRYVRLYEIGKLKLDGLITHRFPLEDINQALAAMESGEADGRCLIEMAPGKDIP